jgi:ribosomal protein S27AE
MKICNSCGKRKKTELFHKRKASLDGLAAKCKECQKDYDKKRSNMPHRVEARSEYAKTKNGIESRRRASRKYSSKNKDKVYKATKEYRENNPKKCKAHGIVAYHVKIGNLKSKACEVCGESKSQAHHDDYDYPLEVRWLCSKHHKEWHAKNGEGKNAT